MATTHMVYRHVSDITGAGSTNGTCALSHDVTGATVMGCGVNVLQTRPLATGGGKSARISA